MQTSHAFWPIPTQPTGIMTQFENSETPVESPTRSARSRTTARSGRSLPVVGLSAVLLVGTLTACGGDDSDVDAPILTGDPVARELFGTHVHGLPQTASQAPPTVGAIRLWDSGVTWREIEPAPGERDWSALDAAVANAEAAGAADIMWVHGNPPVWAAEDPEGPGLYGAGSASPPDVDAYLSILRAVAERYRGRITSYQVWNEANIRIFYRGTPASMARLTARAREALAEVDPDAILVGASTTVRRSGPVKPWYGRYADALAELEWPVDAMAVHLYPLADEGAGTRASYVRFMRDWLAVKGWTGPVYDTEVNYGDRRDWLDEGEKVEVPQLRAAAWVARTYIDSLALGIDRVYWYAWNGHILGIDQVDEQTGEVLPAGQAYLTVQDWFDGARWQGCRGELIEPTGEEGAVTECDLATGDGRPAVIVFSHDAPTTLAMPDGATEVCQVDGTCSEAAGSELPVRASPQLVKL